jgi:hypothetical protein
MKSGASNEFQNVCSAKENVTSELLTAETKTQVHAESTLVLLAPLLPYHIHRVVDACQ